MHAPRSVQLVALLVCGALLFGASRLLPTINAQRKEINDAGIGTASVLENAPPEYAFAVQAFGAFRSLITNIAFMRAEHYKEQGRYYDAVQLGEWICKLQPRFPSVWEFVSWNLAWNISVTTFTPQERWNWVYNGVKLLRDEGLKYNPRAYNMYKQIAWIFNNKMGEMTDDQHLAYKCNWAWRMHLLLGPPPAPVEGVEAGLTVEPVDVIDNPLDAKLRLSAAAEDEKRRKDFQAASIADAYVERKPLDEEELKRTQSAMDEFESAAAKRAAYDFIDAIAKAPATLDALQKQHPATTEMIRQLREIDVKLSDAELTEDEYWSLGGLAWTFFERYRKLEDPATVLRSVLANPEEVTPEETQKVARLGAILGVAEDDPNGAALVRWLQRKVLTEVYRLQPKHMAFVIQEFGAVDWRSVDAQALYWVTLALIEGGDSVSDIKNDRINTARLMFFALRNLFHRGNIAFEPDTKAIHRSYIDLSPDLDFVEAMHLAFVRYGAMIDPKPEEQGGVGYIYRTGHVNFLTEAIRALYLRDRVAEAMHYYRYLANEYGRLPNGQLGPEYRKSLQDYVMDSLLAGLEGYRETELNTQALIATAYDALADGDIKHYNRMIQRGLELWNKYHEDKTKELTERRKLRPFGDLQKDVFGYVLDIPAGSPTALVRKVKLWRNAPLNLKRWVYDDLMPRLQYECELHKFEFAKAFPEPPGMEEFRTSDENIRRLKERERAAETPVQRRNE